LRPLVFTLPYFIYFAAAFGWAFIGEARVISRARKGVSADGAPDDHGSLKTVLRTQMLGFLAAFWLAWKPWGRFPDARVAFWVGLALYVSAAILRRLCFRALGESFTGEVRVRSDQHVVQSGPYRFVRHPSYTAGILLNAGTGVMLGTWLGTLILVTLTTLGYASRVRVEERVLAAKLGAPYSDYMSRTRRFIPFVI